MDMHQIPHSVGTSWDIYYYCILSRPRYFQYQDAVAKKRRPHILLRLCHSVAVERITNYLLYIENAVATVHHSGKPM
jgi:hypothetical protein